MEENTDPLQVNLRNKGIRYASGKVHKGCVKDAYTKLSIGSIPSNYQSIIYHHEEKRAFGTSQKRFASLQKHSDFGKTETEQSTLPNQSAIQSRTSYSRKGFGPLIAKEKRQWMKIPHSPGPGKYFPRTSEASGKELLNNKGQRLCFTRQKEEFRRKEINLNKENESSPGPGTYETHKLDTNLNVCKSSFNGKEKRQAYIQKSLTPGPGFYNYIEHKQSNAALHNIDQKAGFEEEYFNKLLGEKKNRQKQFIEKPKQSESPGPGYYDAQIPVFKPLYERIKISSNFMQNSMDRFNEPYERKRVDEKPNPCSYDLPSTFDKIERKLIEMPCFMSQSRRLPFRAEGMGPNLIYDVGKEDHHNFHFNIRGNWI